MNELIDLDRELFAKINLEWTNSYFDWFFPAITDLHKSQGFLIAALLLLAYWVWNKRGPALKWILVLIIAVGLSDLLSYRVLKQATERPRPQYSGITFELRTHTHSGTSFPSNHSANVFAAATVLSGALPPGAPVFYTIAALVAYSRVYVGVHYPGDVLAGALLGVLIGAFLRRLLAKWLSRVSHSSGGRKPNRRS